MNDVINTTFNLWQVSAYIAVWAYVWVMVITANGGPLEWLYTLLNNYLPWWVMAPLMACEKCHAGQVATWLYLIVYWHRYQPITHLLFITQTILLTLILSACLKQLNK